jgi:hypothetical protein
MTKVHLKNKTNRRMFMKHTGNLKKIIVACIALVLMFSCLFVVANADEHVHEFTEGVCSCGDLKIEVESETPNGTPTDPNGTLVFDKESASGGKVIGNWGKGDNNVTYKFNAPKATKARIGIALVTGWGGTNLITRVNGVDVAFADSFDPFTDWANGWYNFKVYYLNEVELNAGENTIYFEA